jgi:hypothetical protein
MPRRGLEPLKTARPPSNSSLFNLYLDLKPRSPELGGYDPHLLLVAPRADILDGRVKDVAVRA